MDVPLGVHLHERGELQESGVCEACARTILAMPEIQEWIAAAQAETEEIDELDIEF